MRPTPARLAQLLLGVLVVFFVISNTVGDGNALGGVAFVVWVLAAIALIALGVKSLLDRRRNELA